MAEEAVPGMGSLSIEESAPPKLQTIPPEVRTLIWDNLLHIKIATEQPATNSLAILQTCSSLYDEISAHLRKRNLKELKDEFITFHVSPKFDKAWLKVSTSESDRVDLSYEGLSAYKNLPYRNLKEVNIEIIAPDVSDEGQVILLWTKINDIVDTMIHAGRDLPTINIHLLEEDALSILAGWTDFSSWTDLNGEPDHSIHCFDQFSRRPGLGCSDYVVVLLPFCRLRNVAEVSLHLPEGMEDISSMGDKLAIIKQKRNASSEDKGFLNGTLLQKQADDTYFRFEEALDKIDGDTADWMRVDRFARWCNGQDISGRPKSYFEEWERITRQNGKIPFNGCSQLIARYKYFLYLSPESTGMQRIRKRDPLPQPPFHASSSSSGVPSATGDAFFKDGFSPASWTDRDFEEIYPRLSSRLTELLEYGLLKPRENVGVGNDITTRRAWHSLWPKGLPRLRVLSQECEAELQSLHAPTDIEEKIKELKVWAKRTTKEAVAEKGTFSMDMEEDVGPNAGNDL